ncbi:MAG: hypothetical protein C0624_03835 [Desulfuromonas sp.]|nr:MAG: hypothetical protein C0624_03835 [Desulfuromonas sp.]
MPRLIHIAVLGLALTTISCRPLPTEPIVTAESATTPTIRQLTDPAQVQLNQPVTIRGAFKGWSGNCQGGPPVSRSDWMLEDDSGCIYVHVAPPRGHDPLKPNGETLIVPGILKQSSEGTIYLDNLAPPRR